MKGIKKQNLPYKTCSMCNRPFSWRKKWEKNWDEVKYCSDKCRSDKSIGKKAANGGNMIRKTFIKTFGLG